MMSEARAAEPASPGSPSLRRVVRYRTDQEAISISSNTTEAGPSGIGISNFSPRSETGRRLWEEFLKLRMSWDVKCRSSFCYISTGKNCIEKW